MRKPTLLAALDGSHNPRKQLIRTQIVCYMSFTLSMILLLMLIWIMGVK